MRHDRYRQAGGRARSSCRTTAAGAGQPLRCGFRRSPDPQGNDVTGRWPLRSFLELGALPSAVPCARLHTRQLLWEWQLADLADSAELVVSEIVTNAVQVTPGGRANRPGAAVAAGRPGAGPDPGLGCQPAAPGGA